MSKPPQELVDYLKQGAQLEFDPAQSSIGRIRIINEAELAPSVIHVFPGCQTIVDDPYGDIDGQYEVEVYDLVAESDLYRVEGLLCWITAVEKFGCVDAEHGTVLIFPKATWESIVRRPVAYLDAQWESESRVSETLLPWMHFTFRFGDGLFLDPYPPSCPIHGQPLAIKSEKKLPLLEALRRNNLLAWYEASKLRFPYPRVPVAEEKELCCTKCRAAEASWVKAIQKSIPPVPTKRNSFGYVKCPGCGTRFSVTDPNQFRGNAHLSCGQRIQITE